MAATHLAQTEGRGLSAIEELEIMSKSAAAQL
jgi:hypothetical protein